MKSDIMRFVREGDACQQIKSETYAPAGLL